MRRHFSGVLRPSISIKACAVILAALALAAPAGARWKAEYANNPPEVQARFPFKKCCDHADVVKTKFNVNRTTRGDEWFWLDGDKWRRVPDDIIHWGEHAPGGLPTLCDYDGKETCVFPGVEGI